MIEIKELFVSYASKNVLMDLNASFEPSLIHGVLGVNGAGKSTFFNTLYGIKKMDKGRIVLDNKDLDKNDIAYLQTDNFFYPFMKGKEYLQLVAPHTPFQKWNEIFELPLNEFASEYSTGMKKKLAFMGLILRDRKVYILDEPFNGVDIQSNEILIKIIEALKTKEKYVFVSSHILSSLLQMSDKIHHLKEGRFAEAVLKKDFNAFETDFRNNIDTQLRDKLKDLEF